MSTLTDALWERYRAEGEAEARAQLLDRYLGLVHHSARELIRKGARDLELNELISAGTLGLVQAIEGFDPQRGLAFSTYAMPRIRGAMLDELRSRDWMPRSVRTRQRLLARTRAGLTQRLGRPPEPHEMAAELAIELEDYWRWVGETGARVLVTLHQRAGPEGEAGRLDETIPDAQSPEPHEALAREQESAGLTAAFGRLSEKDRTVLALYYYEGLNLRQIGEVLHVTESRVSQIHSRALKRLRVQVDSDGGTS